MNARSPIRHLAQVTLQLAAPLSIGSGRSVGIEDVELVRDANGLPAIPGSSVAGVLRAALGEQWGPAVERELFGFAEGDSGARSRVRLTWAHVHGADDQARDGLILRRDLQSDPLLARLLDASPDRRPHVRISHRGAASDQGLYNRSFVPAGCRFSFRVELDDGDGRLDQHWQSLLATLQSPAFRLGGASRRGYGAVKVHAIHARRFDLRSRADLDDWLTLDASLDGDFTHVLPRFQELPQQHTRWLDMPLQLQPVTPWRVGGGNHALFGADADATPYVEQALFWHSGKGRLQECVVVPGSSIRGALAHRMGWHYQRRVGDWIDCDAEPASENWSARDAHPALRSLLGHVAESTGSPTDQTDTGAVDASRSHWIVDDARIPVADLDANNAWTLQHVSIDRFTGGARDGLLFSEQLIADVPVHTRIAVDAGVSVDPAVRRSLQDALHDLAEGRLALGAGAAHGNGVFQATLDNMHPLMSWLSAAEQTE